MPRRFTRQEFYDLVWSKPITHIAKDFGLSDVAIHKICKKNGVPNPPLGYWAKKANGKPVTQTALPPPEKGMADAIVIAEGSTLSEPDSLRAAREQARINASSAVEEEPAAPHPVLERTITALEKAKPDEKGAGALYQGGLRQRSGQPRIYCEVEASPRSPVSRCRYSGIPSGQIRKRRGVFRS